MARQSLTLGGPGADPGGDPSGDPGGDPGGDQPLRMRGEDAEDLRIISAYLQDAIVPIVEMTYERAERRFVLVAQRFRWEKPNQDAPTDPDEQDEPDERVHCGVRFEAVEMVRAHGLDLRDRSQMLELLTVHAAEGAIDLAFAGDKTIRLVVDRVLCQIEDLGEPWPTFTRPTHIDDEVDDGGEDNGKDDVADAATPTTDKEED
jgi:hypothetical protein